MRLGSNARITVKCAERKIENRRVLVRIGDQRRAAVAAELAMHSRG